VSCSTVLLYCPALLSCSTVLLYCPALLSCSTVLLYCLLYSSSTGGRVDRGAAEWHAITCEGLRVRVMTTQYSPKDIFRPCDAKREMMPCGGDVVRRRGAELQAYSRRSFRLIAGGASGL
jgi:hypothetical protein